MIRYDEGPDTEGHGSPLPGKADMVAVAAGMALVFVGLTANQWVLGSALTSRGVIERLDHRVLIWFFDIACVLGGATLIVCKSRVLRWWRRIALALAAFVLTFVAAQVGLSIYASARKPPAPGKKQVTPVLTRQRNRPATADAGPTEEELARRLTVMGDDELPPLGGRGAKIVEHVRDIGEFKKAVSDAMRLKYVKHPEYWVLDPRYPYITFEVNGMGLRGAECPDEKAAGEVRVFVLGGSAAFSYLEDDEHSFHGRLAEHLNERQPDSAKTYRVFCGAVPGLSSDQELAVLQELILPKKPDVVVVVDGFNDACEKVEPEQYIGNIIRMQDAVRSVGGKLLVCLQPTLVMPGIRPLTGPEERVRRLWATEDSFARYNNAVRTRYPRYLEGLKRNGLDHLHGQRLGEDQLRTAALEPGGRFEVAGGGTFDLRGLRIAGTVSPQAAGGALTLRATDGEVLQLPAGVFQGESELLLDRSGATLVRCSVNGGSAVLANSLERGNWHVGREGLAVPAGAAPMVIAFQSPAPIRSGHLTLRVASARQKADVQSEVGVSFDGQNWMPLPAKSCALGGSAWQADLSWKLRPPEGRWLSMTVRVVLSGAGERVGLDAMTVRLEGRSARPYWSADDGRAVLENGTTSPFRVQAISSVLNRSLFIDEAHLNDLGNDLLAAMAADYILARGW